MTLFDNATYHLAETLSSDAHARLASLLSVNGALVASVGEATHVITDSAVFEGWEGVTGHVVTLASADTDTLSAGIIALGGQFRTGLTRDVTHLFALSSSSPKYETAMHYQKDTGMKVVLPHWFDDVVKLGVRALASQQGAGLDTKPYEWPEPAILRGPLDQVPPSTPSGSKSAVSAEKRALFKSVVTDGSKADTPARDVWGGRRILLSTTLGLSEGRREAVEAGVRRAGGVVVRIPSTPAHFYSASSSRTKANGTDNQGQGDGEEALKESEAEEDAIEGTDIFITRWRGGRAYRKAMKSHKTVASLSWLFFAASLPPSSPGPSSAGGGGGLPSPTEQLLHFPIPPGPCKGFSAHKITLTNYTGEAREYLKRLIAVLGGDFTPNMSAGNTVVVAAFLGGLKTTKALSWSIPVVNHTWLEDCFLQWKALSPACNPRYLSFPQGVDFVGVLGGRGVGKDVFDDVDDEPMDAGDLRANERAEEVEPVGTGVSAKEVEAAVTFGEEESQESPAKDAASRSKAKVTRSWTSTAAEKLDPRPTHENPWPLVKISSPRPLTDMDLDGNADAGPSRKKPKRTPVEDMDEDEVDPMIRVPGSDKPKSTAKSQAKPKVKPKVNGATRTWEEEQAGAPVYDELFDGERDVIVIGGKSANANTRRRSSRYNDDEDEEEEPPKHSRRKSDIKEQTLSTKPKSKKPLKETSNEERQEDVVAVKGKGKKTAPPLPEPSDDDSEDEYYKSIVEAKSLKAKGKRAAPVESSDEEGPAPVKSKAQPKPPKGNPDKKVAPADSTSDSEVQIVAHKTKAKAVAKHDTTTDEDEDAAPPPPQSKGKGKGKDSSEARTPKRVVSVVLPTSSAGKKHIPRTDSLRIEAAEAASGSSPKGPRESLGKRSAAVRATDRLHNVIAPDMNNFAQERKRGFKARRDEWEEEASISGSVKNEVTKKRRLSEGKRKATENGDDGSEEESRPVKAAKKARMTTEDHSDGEVAVKKAKTAGVKHGASTTDPTTVKLMTTQVSLSEDVQKTLTRIGVRFTTKPTECTHLVVAQVVRTEKFLCAMSVAPFILSESWAVESAAAKHLLRKFFTTLPQTNAHLLLAEDRYMLQDTHNEKKFRFTLSDALHRAKANRAGVFDKLTFYVTPKVPVDIKLLKAVVTAGGGSVVVQTPTPRILKANENRHVVSCPADASIWRPLVQNGYVIYSPELLLTGALKQKIDWLDDANRVPDA
ncbi:hypothetical protein HWV62_23847 [Athelia sp. TMB]|nr:hypothetical protein HWV62_23847 [Athelia sp. TMB]